MRRSLIRPIFIWNHRWEYDKNPNEYFEYLASLQDRGVDFGLIVCGKSYVRQPDVFEWARSRFEQEMIHFGYAESRQHYLDLLAQANIALVTNHQDFFGISVVESIYHGCYPILPHRLAYPEHIPSDLHAHHLYRDATDMNRLVHHAISTLDQYDSKPLRDHVESYDWSHQIEQYDVAFEQMIDRTR